MPPFLKSLRQDYLNKRAYLKYMRINSKLIHCCACEHKLAHSYCTTAFVLRTQKIYCKDCFTYFHLYVKSERILNSEYIASGLRMSAMFALFGGMIYGIYYLDLYLKAVDKRDAINQEKTESGSSDELITTDEAINLVNNTFIVVPLIVVLVVIMAWCFYLRFIMAFMRRKRIVWVEV